MRRVQEFSKTGRKFHKTGRPGESKQNLESPDRTGRVDRSVLNVILALKFSLFSLSLSPPLIINHPETVNCCNFFFVSTFVGDFERELSCKRSTRL